MVFPLIHARTLVLLPVTYPWMCNSTGLVPLIIWSWSGIRIVVEKQIHSKSRAVRRLILSTAPPYVFICISVTYIERERVSEWNRVINVHLHPPHRRPENCFLQVVNILTMKMGPSKWNLVSTVLMASLMSCCAQSLEDPAQLVRI